MAQIATSCSWAKMLSTSLVLLFPASGAYALDLLKRVSDECNSNALLVRSNLGARVSVPLPRGPNFRPTIRTIMVTRGGEVPFFCGGRSKSLNCPAETDRVRVIRRVNPQGGASKVFFHCLAQAARPRLVRVDTKFESCRHPLLRFRASNSRLVPVPFGTTRPVVIKVRPGSVIWYCGQASLPSIRHTSSCQSTTEIRVTRGQSERFTINCFGLRPSRG